MKDKRFWRFKNLSDDEAELRIDGDIVDDEDVWIYEWLGIEHMTPNLFREELAKHAGKNLVVWIDTLGGSVWAAAGIYNALKEHDGRVTVKIDGKALSAGSIIAMAGDEVMMSPVGTMMIHNPWIFAAGDAEELRHVAGTLDEIKEAIINAYEIKTGLSRNELSRLMDEETWMSARKAVELGFADGILYADEEPEGAGARAAPAAFAFSRLAVLNKADAAMRRFFDVAKTVQQSSDAVKDPASYTTDEPADDSLHPECEGYGFEGEADRFLMELDLIKLKEVTEDEPDSDS